jgi:hypothetical protein
LVILIREFAVGETKHPGRETAIKIGFGMENHAPQPVSGFFYVAGLKIGRFQFTWAQFDRPLGKAAEGRRSPRRCARHDDS